MSSTLPPSARLALWFSAWVEGGASLDEARDAVVGDDASHHVVGLPDHDDAVPLILALGLLRAEGGRRGVLALPAPGDPLGLAGPAGFNAEVVDAGEGVVVEGAELGLVPHRVGAAVQWTCHDARVAAHVPDPGEADSGLRRALLGTTEQLADLDVARWRPEVADALLDLRREADLVLPRAMAPRAVRLVSLSSRCRTIVELALEDDGGSVTALEADARRAALLPLDHAARRGLVAACAYPWQG
ncbi:hypothetical protein [Nocardioides mesophilus]|uniref:Uncharacterized protein n=1 Tax=Nocardioides mesophilus TaxID=433659 RepID=A0A7G9RB89_9ACTN|nr:hypothetical protein [Nocardioides mesophilus]QNN52864.1 hypothetical protein H9L09_20970 [Nocardioides mesophilus]